MSWCWLEKPNYVNFANRDINLNQTEILIGADEIWLYVRFVHQLGEGYEKSKELYSVHTGIAGLRRIWIEAERVTEGMRIPRVS